ncbi:SpoIID Sporulation protein and related proteins [Candidatus Nanopelagicaceae bacterium]
MRMSKPLILAVLTALIAIPQSSAAELPATFQVHGAGYGHGVGMSQIGAKAKALAGETATAILSYYYKEIAIEPLDDTKILRVNIGHLLTSAKMATATPDATLQIFSGDIGDAQDQAPLATIPVKSSLNFSILGSTVVPSIATGKKTLSIPRNRVFTVRWTGTRYLAGAEGVISLTHNSTTKKYRYGQMQFKAVKASTLGYRLEITNSVRLSDEYLWGISEVPSSWPEAALQAQAIASRTYALNKAGIYRASCDCDLYGEISDQSFLGYAKETEKGWGQFWKAAVTNTAGLTITQLGKPIAAYFTSSSGGLTETAVNAWGSEKSYTQTVADPAGIDPVINPRFYQWDRTITQELAAKAFVLPDVVNLEVLTRNTSGTVGIIRATSSTGVVKTLRGETFRSRTAIPSAYFDLVSVQNAVEPTPSPSP